MNMHHGGPAFPTSAFQIMKLEQGNPNAKPEMVEYPGMTLRQWYAGKAIQGLMANYEWMKNISVTNINKEPLASIIAKVAFTQADAMIAESEK